MSTESAWRRNHWTLTATWRRTRRAESSAAITAVTHLVASLLTAEEVLEVIDEIDLDVGDAEFATLEGTGWEVATGFKSGGSMKFTVTTATNGMSDIDVYLALGEVTNVPIDNLIDFITIKVNGLSVTTVDFDLPKDGSLQQLVLKNTNLIKGENTLEFATSVSDGSNNFIMPAIAAVTLLTDVAMA